MPKLKSNTNTINRYKVHESTELLKFLFERVSDSKNNIKTYLKNKQFLVNGIPVSQFNYPLVKDDIVEFTKIRYKQIENKTPQKESSYKLDIIYEDDTFIALNKPSGMLSIESDTEKLDTIYNHVSRYVSIKSKDKRVYLLHRIDKDTSGVIVFVKDELTRNILSKKWNELVKSREYIAIVDGIPEKKENTIKTYLKKNEVNNLMYSVKNPKDGKLSITNYKVIKSTDKYSLLDVDIETGRKNQIRVHMKEMGNPIIGDPKYGNDTNPINRLGLHAYKLEFYNPIDKKTYVFKAKVPKEFTKLFGGINL